MSAILDRVIRCHCGARFPLDARAMCENCLRKATLVHAGSPEPPEDPIKAYVRVLTDAVSRPSVLYTRLQRLR